MPSVYSVAQVNTYIKNMFQQDYLLQSLYVKGEVSNCKYHPSGHIYFTLKDLKGTISCVMFAGNRNGLSFRLSDGQQVVVGGTVTVYERDGKYQLYAKAITLDGAGQLYEKFQQLKEELYELGMFAPEYKRPIPRYIKTLGVVTAKTGAAVQDIIQIATRRNPYVQIVQYPAIVQGELAADSIVKGIQTLEKMAVDVIIVGRGGGSIEDLWAFNERQVAQAIFDCSVPIISAVGHETDTTIADYVADLRAPTPSAGAELAVTPIQEILGELRLYQLQLNSCMEDVLQAYRQQLAQYETHIKLLSPMNKLLGMKQYSGQLQDRLQERMDWVIKQKRARLALAISELKGKSPLDRLNSGFSYVENHDHKNIRSIEAVEDNEEIYIRMKDGTIGARVLYRQPYT